MEKNIWVFRSASHNIVERNLEYIKKNCLDEKYCIWICVQEECSEKYENRENIKTVHCPNGFFKYDSFRDNEKIRESIANVVFDEVYIPYTMAEPQCDEIIKIAKRTLHVKDKNKIYGYSPFGEVSVFATGWRAAVGVFFSSAVKKIKDGIEWIVLNGIYFYFAIFQRRKGRI